MGRDRSLWEHFGGGRLVVDAVILAVLGLLEYAILSHPASIRPGEGAVLVMAFAGLLILGRRGLTWQRDLALDAFLPDWVARVAGGSRERVLVPQGLGTEATMTARALDALLADVQEAHQALGDLQEAVVRDWREVDAALAEVQAHQAVDGENRTRAAERLAGVGADLKEVFEDTLQLDRIELDQRLRADQWRLQAQAFVGSLEQVKGGLDQFENLVEELRDTFPRLLREGDALGRLANSGMRHGARLGMSVRGLVEHAPRLLEETKTRLEQFRQFRKAADELRDQAEALGRRLEGFRTDAMDRSRAFGGVQGSLKVIDDAAQQAGLLAVNAAILSQQGGGSGAGIQAIGGRLRHLAGQTSRGAAEVERALEEHARGLDHETAGLWTLQEVTTTLLAGIQNLLRSAAYLDQQGQELERLLDTQVAQVDQVRQMSEHAELALHEVGERARAIEGAMGRLWAVEAKLLPELERLSRGGTRLTDSGRDLSRISQQNIEAIWSVLARHQAIRRNEAYRQVTAGELGRLLDPPASDEGSPARVAWIRSLRRGRLAGSQMPLPALRGLRTPDGAVRLRLLGLDALGLPEPGALQHWAWSRGGRDWRLDLREELRTEDHRMALLESLRHSELQACFPDLQTRITPEGAFLSLPFPLGQLPAFLAGLALELPLGADGWEGLLRAPRPVPEAVQAFLWVGPDQDPALGRETLRQVHALVHGVPDHHHLLPQARYEGERPACRWLGETETACPELSGAHPIRFENLGVADAAVSAWRERILQIGGREGAGGAALAVARVAPIDPALLVIQLYRREANLACMAHPALAPYRDRVRSEVFALEAPDPTGAAWEVLEAFQSEGWLLPLPAL